MSRAGRTNFKICQVKNVSVEPYFNETENIQGATAIRPDLIGLEKREPGKRYALATYIARVACPGAEDRNIEVTSDQGLKHTSSRYALKSLMNFAGNVLCDGCEYPKLTPTQVSIRRAEFADAEAERLSAFARLQAARAEVGQLEQTALRPAMPQLPPAAE